MTRVPGTVYLDDQPQLGPEHVDLVTEHLDVGDGLRQPIAKDRVEQVLLLALGPGTALEVGVDRFFEPFELVPADEPRGGRADGVEVQPIPMCGLMHDVGELLDGQEGGEIHDRARNGRRRDPIAHGDVPRVEPVAPMHADTRDCDLPGGDDADRTLRAPESPKLRGRQMGERGAHARREHRGQPTRLSRQSGMADGIDAAMHAVQEPACTAATRPGGAHPRGAKVLRPDQPVLTRRDLRNPRVGCVRLVAPRGINCTHPSSLSHPPERNKTRSCRNCAYSVTAFHAAGTCAAVMTSRTMIGAVHPPLASRTAPTSAGPVEAIR